MPLVSRGGRGACQANVSCCRRATRGEWVWECGTNRGPRLSLRYLVGGFRSWRACERAAPPRDPSAGWLRLEPERGEPDKPERVHMYITL
eukprot:scaffold265_cov118-Isochrysis_galbana.AAC.1